MSGPEHRLLTWLTRAAQPSSCAVEARHEEATQCRGLCATQHCSAGDTLLRVPWNYVLTVHSAVRRLSSLERKQQQLTHATLADVLQLAAAASSQDLVPPGSGWSLLLTLQLLAELRDKRSLFAPYVATLPAPSGSALSVAAHGPAPGCHLSLCTPAQLECLNCPALMHAVLAERTRLCRLHAALFGDDAPLSFDSFAWAHALVASRAVGLCMDATDAPSVRCLIPGIDLCNHSGCGATASLRLTTAADAPVHRVGALVTPSAVELVAAGDLAEGAACLLDYGAHRLRHWCATYAFIPDDDARAEEVYEEVSLGDTGREQLLVTSSGGGSHLRLTVIHLQYSAVTYHVSNADPAVATRVVLDDRLLRFLPPEEEAGLCRALGVAAKEVASRMARDEDFLHALACNADAAAAGLAPPSAHLAARFRAARLQLLRRASDGLMTHAMLLCAHKPSHDSCTCACD